MQPKSKREQCAAALAGISPIAQLTMFSCLHAAWRAHRDGTAPTLTDEQRRALKRQRRRKGPRQRFKRAATPVALLLVLALASGCAGVTAEDLAPHVATAQNLAERNNAAIAIHCVGMADDDRQALIRDNIDHAAQLGALQQSAGDGPGWLSQVIAWALSFSRLAGIVAADPEIESPEQPAMDGDGNTTEPETPAPDDDGDGLPEATPDALFPKCGCCGAALPPSVPLAMWRGELAHASCVSAHAARTALGAPDPND